MIGEKEKKKKHPKPQCFILGENIIKVLNKIQSFNYFTNIYWAHIVGQAQVSL